MKNCKNCGKEVGIGTYSLVSDYCDECYIKINFYKPDFEYPMPKREIKRVFGINTKEKKYNFLDIMIMFNNFEQELYEKLKQEAKEQNKVFVRAFKEYNFRDKIHELIAGKQIELTMSYFFCNNNLNTVANYEDRNKEGGVLIVE